MLAEIAAYVDRLFALPQGAWLWHQTGVPELPSLQTVYLEISDGYSD